MKYDCLPYNDIGAIYLSIERFADKCSATYERIYYIWFTGSIRPEVNDVWFLQ